MRRMILATFGVWAIHSMVGLPAAAGDNWSITLEKTVITPSGTCPGIDPLQIAAGTQVGYCYTVSNNTGMTFTTHSLVDSVLGTITIDPPCTLAPWASNGCNVTVTTVISVDTMNLATWTTGMTGSMISDTDTAKVIIRTPPVITPDPNSGSSTVTGKGDPACVGGQVLIFDCGFPPDCHHCTGVTIPPNNDPCPDALIGTGSKDANGNFVIPLSLLPGAGHKIYATDGCTDPGLVGADVLIQAVHPAPVLSPRSVVMLAALLALVGIVGLRARRSKA